MIQKILIAWAGVIVGVVVGIFLIDKTNILNIGNKDSSLIDLVSPAKSNAPVSKKVIGFLPFWLIDKAASDYSPYITQLSYFNLVIDGDGTIQKYTSPGESDPGYHSLFSGKVDDYLANAKSKGLELSLTIFSGNDENINKFLEKPELSAQNLITDITPILEEHDFTDLNLDIEKVGDATPDQRKRYVDFVSEVRKLLDQKITITIDVPGISFVKDKNLADPKSLAKIADYIVFMGYDFHNPGSFVTGPVAPQSGAGIVSEFDIESATQAALTQMPASKLILAVPMYGYSWETINPFPRSATMPGSGYSISAKSVDELLASCTTCTSEFDKTDSETHTIYKDEGTGLYHQVFYPNKESTQVKVDFAASQKLGGMALWALGYEDESILTPLAEYLR